MRFSLPASTLAAALGQVARVVERRNTIPILSHVRITAKADGIEIKATDLDIEILTAIEASVAEPGAIALPAAMLASIAAKLPKTAETTIALDPAGNVATLTSGRARYQLNALPASDYPDLTIGEFPILFRMPAKSLARIAERLAFAISSEEARYYLNGIYFHIRTLDGQDALAAVATDGHRLARMILPLPEGAAGMPGVIIPRKTVGEIERFAKGDEEATVEVSDTKIRLSIGRSVLTSKLIDGTFPDYGRVIPQNNTSLARLQVEAFKGAVSRATTVSSERGSAVKFAFAEESLTVSCINPDAGSASETIDGLDPIAPIEIGFNARYIGDALDRIETDQLIMALDQPGAPALVHEPGKADEFLIVLMPMRV